MTEQKEGNSKRGAIQLAGLFLLLIVLPIGSWYYLRTGLNYRIEAREELQPIADLPAAQLQNYNGQKIRLDRFKNELLVGHFFSENHQSTYLPLLTRVYDQFDERSEVFFLNLNADTSAEMRSRIMDNLDEELLMGEDKMFFVFDDQVSQLARDLKMPFEERSMSLEDNTLLFFADSATVKYIYDFSKPDDVKMLIKHLTLNLHPDEEEDIIFERETEK